MNDRSRHAAMKRYFKYADKSKPAFYYPKENLSIEFYNQSYNVNCFTDAYSCVLTFGDIGDMETYDEYCDKPYIDIQTLFNYLNGDYARSFGRLVDVNSVITKAKEAGYKFKKNEIMTSDKFKYIWKYHDRYYKIGILDQAFSIINTKDKCHVVCGPNGVLFIDNMYGMVAIMPYIWDKCNRKDEVTVIELEESEVDDNE